MAIKPNEIIFLSPTSSQQIQEGRRMQCAQLRRIFYFYDNEAQTVDHVTCATGGAQTKLLIIVHFEQFCYKF